MFVSGRLVSFGKFACYVSLLKGKTWQNGLKAPRFISSWFMMSLRFQDDPQCRRRIPILSNISIHTFYKQQFFIIPLKWPCFFSLLIWHPFRFDVVFETRLHRLCEVVDRFIEAPICGVDLEGHAMRNAKALVGDIEITKSYIKKHDLECCDQKMYILHIFWWFHVISYFVNPRYVMSYICCLVDGWFYAFCNILLGCWLGQVQHVPKSMI